jgi:molybdopterin-binding protein
MKISAQNKLMGKVVSIEKGAVNSIVKIELSANPVITAVITNAAVEDLELELGTAACAVVKSSNVMVGICGEGKKSSECSSHSCGCQGHK